MSIDREKDATDIKTARRFEHAKDYVAARAIFERLASAGNLACQVHLGWMDFKGVGTSEDRKAALEWFVRAAESGSAEGAFFAGKCAWIARDYAEALRWYRIAIQAEYGPALFGIGDAYAFGLGVPMDAALAKTYYERAARAGNLRARLELSLLMMRGKLGVWRIPVGVLLFPYAIIAALAGALTRGYSQKLMS